MNRLSPPAKAAIWMSGAVVSFTSMAVAGREVSHRLDTFELMSYRSLIGLLIVLGVLAVRNDWGAIGWGRIPQHGLRNLFHFTGQNLWFYAVTVIPFAQLFALEFSVPLWVAIAAPFFLNEKLTPMRLAAAITGFIGILIVARPGALPITPGIIAAGLCALAFAATSIATKRLTRAEPTISIMFWLTLIQLCLGAVCVVYDGDVTLPDATTLPWVVLVGLAGLLAHYCITTALQIAPAVIVTPMDFARLPIIAVIGMAFYGEALDVWVIVGAVIIFGANYANIRAEARLSRAAG